MYNTARDLVDSMAAAPDALDGLLAGVHDDLARSARGGDEGWSVVEVLCHLRDAEERAVERLIAMRDQDEPLLAGYDQDAWAIERDYAGDDLRRAAAAFARHRADHVAALVALPAAAWMRAGRHEEWGWVTIENHTIHIATHDLQHLAQVARALRDARTQAASDASGAAQPSGRDPVSDVALVARAATSGDAAAIARIYNDGIEDRLATFETRSRTTAEVLGWFDGRHPIVVVEEGATVVGFAATATYRPRACYDGVAEFSVYVARTSRGRGVGRLATEALVATAADASIWKLVSRVFLENEASLRLLRGLGFREVGVYERHGRLDGRWRDVVIVEKLLPAAFDEVRAKP